MDITVALSTYNRPDILRQCVKAIVDSNILITRILVIDNSLEHYAANSLEDYKQIKVITPTQNKGLSGTWNYFFRTYSDYIIIPNDDIIVHTHTIAEMVSAADKTNDVLYFGAKDGFSFYLLKHIGWQQAGGFDETFNPIYFEDNDMAYKLRLLGYNPVVVPTATFEHLHGGSSTLKAFNQNELAAHHNRFIRNQNYYIKKWGGLPGQETYVTAFNK